MKMHQPYVICVGKEAFASQPLAARVARAMRARHQSTHQPYKCPSCGAYRIGRRISFRKRPRKRKRMRRLKLTR